VQVIEHQKDRRQQELDDRNKHKICQHLGEKQLRAWRRSHALRVENLVANLARPGLVERAHRSEHGGHAQDAAGDLAREGAARVKRQ